MYFLSSSLSKLIDVKNIIKVFNLSVLSIFNLRDIIITYDDFRE